MNKPLRIGLVDDKKVNRTSITDKLRQFDNLDLCFVAINGNDCMEQLKLMPLHKMPQVIFMDLEMPGMNGIQTISIARSLYPDIYFIVLTIFDDNEKIFDAIRAGAHGYLLKDESAAGLRDAIVNIAEHGGAPMSAAIARKAFQILSRVEVKPDDTKTETGVFDELLTAREKEILQQTIKGHDAKRVAEIMNSNVLTVRKHIANIYRKLHVSSKAQVIAMAHKNNWPQ